MKRLSIAVISSIICVYAQASSESLCLMYGGYGALFVEGREIMSEAEMLEIIKKDFEKKTTTNKDKNYVKAWEVISKRQKVILDYVVTMDLDAVTARKMVYLKCKAGDFD